MVRSGPAFALSLVLSSVEPVLRSAAELGAWQIISPVSTAGRVVEVQGLHEVQDMVRLLPRNPQAASPLPAELPRHAGRLQARGAAWRGSCPPEPPRAAHPGAARQRGFRV